jgi:hypothetical protein
MPDYTLDISKDGEKETGQILLRVGTQNIWHVTKAPSWFNYTGGTWMRGRTATKFRQMSYISLIDTTSNGYDVARLPEFPYSPGSKFKASLVAKVGFLQTDSGSFDVEVEAGPPTHKTFRIREVWGGAASYLVFQVETVTFEINDPSTQETATYVYKGFGIGFGLPIKKLPPVLPGGSGGGPWNNFEAPGWWTVRDFGGDVCLQAPYNVGLGTSKSYNILEFRGHVDNYPGYEVEINDFQTGNTYALPSSGVTSGSMELATPGKAPVNPR